MGCAARNLNDCWKGGKGRGVASESRNKRKKIIMAQPLRRRVSRSRDANERGEKASNIDMIALCRVYYYTANLISQIGGGRLVEDRRPGTKSGAGGPVCVGLLAQALKDLVQR